MGIGTDYVKSTQDYVKASSDWKKAYEPAKDEGSPENSWQQEKKRRA